MRGYQYLQTPAGDYSIVFSKPEDVSNLIFGEELPKAAVSLSNRAKNRSLWLCLSGGHFSFAMAEAFYEAGVQFSVLMLIFDNSSSHLNRARVEKWCYDRNIVLKTKMFSQKDFWENEMKRFIQEYEYVSTHISPYVRLALLEEVSLLGGYAVMGGGLNNIRKITNGSERTEAVGLRLGEYVFAPLNWIQGKNIDHEPYFFWSTPELLVSFFQHPLFVSFLKHPQLFMYKRDSITISRLVLLTKYTSLPPANRNDYEYLLRVLEQNQSKAPLGTRDATIVEIDELIVN